VNEEPSGKAVFANDPGVFGAEVYVASEDAYLGLNWADGDEFAQITVLQGDVNISLDLTPSDLPRLRQALDCCEQRMAADKEAFRADADEQAN
tara:strand:- start:166 stop:444 length:279 start_codon:yes stop_codon:yes gene_type:complete